MVSILTSTKKLLGIDEEYEAFDQDIIVFINSAFSRLNQLGIGPEEGFVITSKTQTWSEIIESRLDLESIKTYVYLKVRLVFDPPQSSFLVDAFKEQIAELEWTINVQVEGGIHK